MWEWEFFLIEDLYQITLLTLMQKQVLSADFHIVYYYYYYYCCWVKKKKKQNLKSLRQSIVRKMIHDLFVLSSYLILDLTQLNRQFNIHIL